MNKKGTLKSVFLGLLAIVLLAATFVLFIWFLFLGWRDSFNLLEGWEF